MMYGVTHHLFSLDVPHSDTFLLDHVQFPLLHSEFPAPELSDRKYLHGEGFQLPAVNPVAQFSMERNGNAGTICGKETPI